MISKGIILKNAVRSRSEKNARIGTLKKQRTNVIEMNRRNNFFVLEKLVIKIFNAYSLHMNDIYRV